jgi:hypothetical protein
MDGSETYSLQTSVLVAQHNTMLRTVDSGEEKAFYCRNGNENTAKKTVVANRICASEVGSSAGSGI